MVGGGMIRELCGGKPESKEKGGRGDGMSTGVRVEGKILGKTIEVLFRLVILDWRSWAR